MTTTMRRRGAAILAGLTAAAVLVLAAGGAEAGKRERAEEAIRQADIDFYEALKAKDEKRFRRFLADDTVFYGEKSVSQGPDQVVQGWSVFFQKDAPATVIWKPRRVEASKSGDMGFSIGVYEIKPIGASAEAGAKSVYGHYVTIWRNEGGSWKAIVDVGTPPSPEMP